MSTNEQAFKFGVNVLNNADNVSIIRRISYTISISIYEIAEVLSEAGCFLLILSPRQQKYDKWGLILE